MKSVFVSSTFKDMHEKRDGYAMIEDKENELSKENMTAESLEELSFVYKMLGGKENQEKACEMYEKSLVIEKELLNS